MNAIAFIVAVVNERFVMKESVSVELLELFEDDSVE